MKDVGRKKSVMSGMRKDCYFSGSNYFSLRVEHAQCLALFSLPWSDCLKKEPGALTMTWWPDILNIQKITGFKVF